MFYILYFRGLGRYLQRHLLIGCGCGSVGRAVALDTRGPWFESSQRQIFIENICLLSTVMKRRK